MATQHVLQNAHDTVVTGLRVSAPPAFGNANPRPGFRLVAGVVNPRRSRRHSAPTTVTLARAAQRIRTPPGRNPDDRHPAPGRLAVTPTRDRLCGRAYA